MKSGKQRERWPDHPKSLDLKEADPDALSGVTCRLSLCGGSDEQGKSGAGQGVGGVG